jgi:hypothetical protein
LEVDTALEIVAGSAVVDDGDGLVKVGERNAIGEHVLGFPREYGADRGIAFNQVKHNRSGSH